ncbi:MAG: phosphohistidine phosphatase [Chlorobium sp.]|nr:MAG: phosphohistidine phosphatase [Chlorobium sp.]
MKTIYIVRHAKSGWENAQTEDFDRTLNEKGMKAAPFMAALLKEKDVHPDLVFSSPANRAITTAELFCDILGYPKEKIRQQIEIYEGISGHLLNIVQQIPDNCKTVMIFGHNPTLTDFSNQLTGDHFDNLVPGGVVRIDMNITFWKDAAPGTGKTVWYEFPQKNQ